MERISELSSEELTELAFVNSEIETALTSNPIFRPDQFNYLQLGNQLHHLHLHGIPRYASPREAFGRNWVDETFGAPPVWSADEVGSELVSLIRQEVVESFKQLSFLDG